MCVCVCVCVFVFGCVFVYVCVCAHVSSRDQGFVSEMKQKFYGLGLSMSRYVGMSEYFYPFFQIHSNTFNWEHA